MTSKEDQQITNDIAKSSWELVFRKIEHGSVKRSKEFKLFNCQATYSYITSPLTGEIMGAILTSYNTQIAMIIIDGTFRLEVDMLRHEYGYTSTSRQHMSKFFKHILNDNYYTAVEHFTYR